MFLKRSIKSIICILITHSICFAQKSNDSISMQKELSEVMINATKANKKTPVAFTDITKSEIENANLGQDLPYLISLTPSVVTSSDAGAGIGYTNFRIRGTDPTRINVTINGIPLNDSESQGVWWVNMPDFSSSLENIQIQRGVGTSTNGAGAFGGSINLTTNKISQKPYFLTENTLGSFETLKNNIKFGTGIINNNFSFEGRLSKITSEGYIDRASSDLRSLYLQGSYFGATTSINAIMFHGHEKTYQAWNGVPLNFLDTNRTYNSYTYENEIDNYQQTHYQLHFNKQIDDKTSYNVAAHYTHGEGYYEQEKLNESLSDYGLNNIIFSLDTISSSDLIRRKWLNNDFGGVTYSLKHKMDKVNLILGGATNHYSGQHYGNIIWMQYASNSQFDHQYYWNKANKIDQNMFAKADYKFTNNTNLYLDLQRRNIEYTFTGPDEYNNMLDQEVNLSFFNPKFGLFHNLNNQQSVYVSFAVANKEPNRNDYVESTPNSRPKHETLYDTEIGYKKVGDNINFNINFYQMLYENQLVLTGKINDVGAYTRTNIKDSYRRGLELMGSLKLNQSLKWSANLTLSENKINEYTEYVDNWDNWGQEEINHKNTDLAFSPNIIWSSLITYKLNKNINVEFINKYVGKQFIDNTSSNDRILNDYLVNHLRFKYEWNSKYFKQAKITLQINNLLDNEYVNNAWVYRFISDGYDPRSDDPYVNADSERGYNMAGYFPQATRNYLLGITLGL